MKLIFTRETSGDLTKKLDFLHDLSDMFSEKLIKNIDTIYICLNCVDPEIGIGRDFETGLMIYKKYIKSKKYLEITYKLNHKQVTDATTREEVLAIILEGFKKTYPEVKALNIKDFDIDNFYNVVSSGIEDFAKNEYIPKERFFIGQFATKQLSKAVKMDEIIFWQIIEQSKEESKDFEGRINLIIDKLSNLSEKEIVSFEFTFRDMLSKSVHYNILAVITIIENFVSDDTFLYFRCRLLAEGKDFYFKAIKKPDELSDILNFDLNGELMLSVSDKAFLKKFGKDTDKELPRDIAFTYRNYDEGEEIFGDEWNEVDLPRKFPKLWTKYR